MKELTLQKIAQPMGIATSAFYLHFCNKELIVERHIEFLSCELVVSWFFYF
ncbi:MAG: TetR family transcriptional regulator [Candidatus Cloacimonetes bacterium]|nr:TetR family transcriptional regulator [Candidatus Cloacimonadota bacterium]